MKTTQLCELCAKSDFGDVPLIDSQGLPLRSGLVVCQHCNLVYLVKPPAPRVGILSGQTEAPLPTYGLVKQK
jgi:hypothetical protein